MEHYLNAQVRYVIDNGTIHSVLGSTFFVILLLYDYSDKPLVLRRALLVIPVLLLLYLIGGNPGEFRIVFEIFPIILLSIGDTLRRMISETDRTRA